MANTYRTVQGDTWDIISKKQYGSEKFVDVLITENYKQRNTMIFGAGVVINVPDVSEDVQQSQNLPPWRRS